MLRVSFVDCQGHTLICNLGDGWLEPRRACLGVNMPTAHLHMRASQENSTVLRLLFHQEANYISLKTRKITSLRVVKGVVSLQ